MLGLYQILMRDMTENPIFNRTKINCMEIQIVFKVAPAT